MQGHETEKRRERVMSAIARGALDEALRDLDNMPTQVSNSVVRFHAHTLNNYLTVTGGIIELILIEQSENLDTQAKLLLEDVAHATSMMIRTVSHLMTASATKEMALRFEMIDDLPTMVQQTCIFYQRAAEQKSISVSVDFATDIPPVSADRVAVQAILDNLVFCCQLQTQRKRNIAGF
jgi:signal transduction histidine kinase